MVANYHKRQGNYKKYIRYKVYSIFWPKLVYIMLWYDPHIIDGIILYGYCVMVWSIYNSYYKGSVFRFKVSGEWYIIHAEAAYFCILRVLIFIYVLVTIGSTYDFTIVVVADLDARFATDNYYFEDFCVWITNLLYNFYLFNRNDIAGGLRCSVYFCIWTALDAILVKSDYKLFLQSVGFIVIAYLLYLVSAYAPGLQEVWMRLLE